MLKQRLQERLDDLVKTLEQSAGQHNLLVGRKQEIEHLIAMLEEAEKEDPPAPPPAPPEAHS